ncbi:hypothetical protein CDL15_Pgr004502 [Punica granatum]|uniref:Uncharacterized protein n=1 Tax=Punica granatum TaxID=22663 RepID=A0A218WZ15_PUNGR|nr:hypothetical protein CDL15_Pgr004502 [Punica granatum]
MRSPEAAASLRMPRSCDEGLELWGRAPTYPEGSEIRVRRSSCICCTYDSDIIRIGWLSFSLLGPSTRLEVMTCYMSQSRVRRGEDASQGSRLHLRAEKRKPTKDFSCAPSTKP